MYIVLFIKKNVLFKVFEFHIIDENLLDSYIYIYIYIFILRPADEELGQLVVTLNFKKFRLTNYPFFFFFGKNKLSFINVKKSIGSLRRRKD